MRVHGWTVWQVRRCPAPYLSQRTLLCCVDSVITEMGPGSFGINAPGTFNPFKEIDDTTFEIYAMEGDTSLKTDMVVPVTIVLI
jgi:hypothetical protein